jgi:hypothetical protein
MPFTFVLARKGPAPPSPSIPEHYRVRVSDFIATVSPDALGNWDICKREGLWGVIEKGGSATGVANARRVHTGDRIFVWLGKPKRGRAASGLVAQVEALGPYVPVRTGTTVPWPNASDYAGVFPIRLVAELAIPEPDTFPGPERVGVRFGLQNMALIHGFRSITPDVAERRAAVLPASRSNVGVPFVVPPSPTPVAAALPFDVDPDLVDRALGAHRDTLVRMSGWITKHGLESRLPATGEPLYDLAWIDGDVLNVAEIKSVTAVNEEQQLRLGLGQVLRYRSILAAARPDFAEVRAWLVPERTPSDSSWITTCATVGVELLVP